MSKKLYFTCWKIKYSHYQFTFQDKFPVYLSKMPSELLLISTAAYVILHPDEKEIMHKNQAIIVKLVQVSKHPWKVFVLYRVGTLVLLVLKYFNCCMTVNIPLKDPSKYNKTVHFQYITLQLCCGWWFSTRVSDLQTEQYVDMAGKTVPINGWPPSWHKSLENWGYSIFFVRGLKQNKLLPKQLKREDNAAGRQEGGGRDGGERFE